MSILWLGLFSTGLSKVKSAKTNQKSGSFAKHLANEFDDSRVIVRHGMIFRNEILPDEAVNEKLVAGDHVGDVGGRYHVDGKLDPLTSGHEKILVVKLLEYETRQFAQVLSGEVFLVREAA